MRRLAVPGPAVVMLLLLLVAGCRNDGRTLREPPAGFEGVSISTTSTPVEGDDGFGTLEPFDTAAPETFPPLEATDLVLAPWADGDVIDSRYTCDGLNVSPALSWTPAPLGTAEIAITFEDLDAPTFVHWIVAGIAPDVTEIDEDAVPIGAYQATNGVGDIGYTGPCPPAGSEHLYLITVHYLGTPSGLQDGVPGDELYASIAAAAVASGEVTGTFSRPGG